MGKNVEALAALLNQPIETVQTALEAEGGLVDRITAFRKDFTVLNKADKDKLVSNAKEEGKQELLDNFDPKVLSRKDQNRIAAWKLEEVETEFKEKYGFEGDYRGIADLVDKIVKSKSGNNGGSQADKDEITKLKEQITKLTDERDGIKTQSEAEMDAFVIRSEFERSINGIDLDYDTDTIPKQRKLFADSFNGSYDVKRKDGKVIVYPKGANDPLMDEKRDPLPIDTIIAKHAEEYGFKIKSPGNGGQGGSSSSRSANPLKGMTEAQLRAYAESKGVRLLSPEGVQLHGEWKAANKS